jgi:hypothetical protein
VNWAQFLISVKMARIIIPRIRFLLAVEGDGEQSFIKWLGELSDAEGLNTHLDCRPLDGGGYKSMLVNAVLYRKRQNETKGKPKASILLVDGDRAVRDDGWTIAQLREAAHREGFQVCVQSPNQEGLLLRMLPRNERLLPDALSAKRQLQVLWPNYDKGGVLGEGLSFTKLKSGRRRWLIRILFLRMLALSAISAATQG